MIWWLLSLFFFKDIFIAEIMTDNDRSIIMCWWHSSDFTLSETKILWVDAPLKMLTSTRLPGVFLDRRLTMVPYIAQLLISCKSSRCWSVCQVLTGVGTQNRWSRCIRLWFKSKLEYGIFDCFVQTGYHLCYYWAAYLYDPRPYRWMLVRCHFASAEGSFVHSIMRGCWHCLTTIPYLFILETPSPTLTSN